MPVDRTDEIRIILFRQRIDRFMKYVEKKCSHADGEAEGSGSSWNHAYAQAWDEVRSRARKIFSGKEDKPVNLE